MHQVEVRFPHFFEQINYTFNKEIPELTIEFNAKCQTNCVATTYKNHIKLSFGIQELEKPLFKFIFAHEICHVLQMMREYKQGEVSHNSVESLELECNSAAMAFMNGQKFNVKLSDKRFIPRNFDYQGHFYTTYLVALLAGVPHENAKQLAYYAQLPDQISELDAMGAIAWLNSEESLHLPYMDRTDSITQTAFNFMPSAGTVLGSIKSAIILDNDPTYYRILQMFYGTLAANYMVSSAKYVSYIQAGLHCLTGGNSQKESLFRYNILLKGDPVNAPIGFGGAIHALADSYAHRKINKEQEMSRNVIGHALSGHEPDNIGNRVNLYLLYCEALYRVFCYKFPSSFRLVEQEAYLSQGFNERLKNIMMDPCSTKEEGEQVGILRRLIRTCLGEQLSGNTSKSEQFIINRLKDRPIRFVQQGQISRYRPNGQSKSFRNYVANPNHDILNFTKIDLGTLIANAFSWSLAKRD